ncbi:unnamed protein product, partial [Phaeothamnion confervicola]
MYVIALGTGGIKPNMATFCAEQFDETSPRDQEDLRTFWTSFYWRAVHTFFPTPCIQFRHALLRYSINLGALVAYTAVSYVCQFGIPAAGGEEWGFVIGYSIPCV